MLMIINYCNDVNNNSNRNCNNNTDPSTAATTSREEGTSVIRVNCAHDASV